MPEPFVTIVSGLPRSGTSLMMQMLQAGGVRLLTDQRRRADAHNPKGYFELELVKNSGADTSWVEDAQGRAVKVIHLLLRHLPGNKMYRVIFMLRDIREVLASQRAMLQDSGRAGAAIPDDKLAAVFEKQLAEVKEWLADRPNFRVLYLNHREVIAQPLAAAREVTAFLEQDLQLAAMAAVLDRTLYRQRVG